MDYSTVYDIEEILIPNGEKHYLEYGVMDENGVPLDLSSYDCWCDFSYFGETDKLFSKFGTVYNTSNFRITLEPDDTLLFIKPLIQQPYLVDYYGRYTLGQGIIKILKKPT